MQAVRCDACGHKALVAASQCPHCGHLFDLRDSFGELLPLAHCATCDSDYPRRNGSCKWCGTTPDVREIPRHALLRGMGVVAFAGLALGVWATRESPPTQHDGGRSDKKQAEVLVRIPDPLTAAVSTPPSATSGPVDTTTTQPPDPAELRREEPAAAREATETDSPVASPPVLAVDVPTTRPLTRRVSRVATTRSLRWRTVVAAEWLTIRAAPTPRARLLGSIGPDTRVQVGELRDGWIRVRTRGLAGWARHEQVATHLARVNR